MFPLILPRALAAATKSCWLVTMWMPCTSPCRQGFASHGSSARQKQENTCSWKSRSAPHPRTCGRFSRRAGKSGVQFMDGVMFMHSRRLESIRKILADDQSIGPLKRITSQFTFGAASEFFASNIRTNDKLEPLGCLGDLGWYNIRFTLWAMNWELPAKVTGRILAEHRRPDSPAAVPTDFSAELFYADGVSAGFYCSYLAEIQQWANLGGTKGSLYVPDFVLPWYGAEVAFEVSNPVYNVTGCDFNMEEHTRRFAVREYSNSAENAQETNMFRRFAELALSGRPDHCWGEMTLKTQQVLDACLQSARSGGCIIDLTG